MAEQPGYETHVVAIGDLKLEVVNKNPDNAWRLAANPNGPVPVPTDAPEAQGWEVQASDQPR